MTVQPSVPHPQAPSASNTKPDSMDVNPQEPSTCSATGPGPSIARVQTLLASPTVSPPPEYTRNEFSALAAVGGKAGVSPPPKCGPNTFSPANLHDATNASSSRGHQFDKFHSINFDMQYWGRDAEPSQVCASVIAFQHKTVLVLLHAPYAAGRSMSAITSWLMEYLKQPLVGGCKITVVCDGQYTVFEGVQSFV